MLRGRELWERFTPEANREARRLYEKAIELDPDYARAYASLAWTYVDRAFRALGGSEEQPLERALEIGASGVSVNPASHSNHLALGQVCLSKGLHDEALEALETAIALNPNDADGYAFLAQALSFAGRPEEAIELVEKARRLNPAAPRWYSWNLGMALYLARRYDDAVTAFRKGRPLGAIGLPMAGGGLWPAGTRAGCECGRRAVPEAHARFLHRPPPRDAAFPHVGRPRALRRRPAQSGPPGVVAARRRRPRICGGIERPARLAELRRIMGCAPSDRGSDVSGTATDAMRFGVVGYGAFGRLHAQCIDKVAEARLGAICAQQRRGGGAGAGPISRTSPSTATTRRWWPIPPVDVVDVVTPNHTHAEIGAAALEAGKDLLLEKPMATTLEGCDRLIAAARAQGSPDQRRPRAAPLEPVGDDQAADRRRRDRPALLCQLQPLPPSLSPGRGRLAP